MDPNVRMPLKTSNLYLFEPLLQEIKAKRLVIDNFEFESFYTFADFIDYTRNFINVRFTNCRFISKQGEFFFRSNKESSTQIISLNNWKYFSKKEYNIDELILDEFGDFEDVINRSQAKRMKKDHAINKGIHRWNSVKRCSHKPFPAPRYNKKCLVYSFRLKLILNFVTH